MVLFALGTDHWWLAMVGQMWFVSQLLTLLCAAAAVLLVLKKGLSLVGRAWHWGWRSYRARMSLPSGRFYWGFSCTSNNRKPAA